MCGRRPLGGHHRGAEKSVPISDISMSTGRTGGEQEQCFLSNFSVFLSHGHLYGFERFFLLAASLNAACSLPWCESRGWQSLGHRTVSLEPPGKGARNRGRLYRQDWDEAHNNGANGRYKVIWVFSGGKKVLKKRDSDGSVQLYDLQMMGCYSEIQGVVIEIANWGSWKKWIWSGDEVIADMEWWKNMTRWARWKIRTVVTEKAKSKDGKQRNKTQPRVSGTTMNTWEWRENIRPVHEFEPQSADTWKEGPDHDWMMMIGGTFPVLPFQPPGMSIRNGLSTQNLRKAQECGGLMMGLDIYHGNIPQRSGSPWLKDRWLPGAQSGVLTFKGREGFTLMLYNLHGVYVNNGFGHIRKESTLIISGGPGSFCTRTVQLKKEIAERPRSHLERRRPLVTKQRSNTIPKESLELVKQKLRKHKAGDTQTMAEEVVGLMENLKFSEDELMDWVAHSCVLYCLERYPIGGRLPLGPNLFLFKFKKVEDREFVLNRCPWSFDGELLALKPFDGERIGATMGVHKAVDLQEGDGRMGEYLRVRTEIDSLKPLRRFIALGKLVDGRLRMCPVKYERLPRFFFNCGRIGHVGNVSRQARRVQRAIPVWGLAQNKTFGRGRGEIDRLAGRGRPSTRKKERRLATQTQDYDLPNAA
ncbi:hypothetical protein GQ457_12G000180 [Hibiscus cannabinus]